MKDLIKYTLNNMKKRVLRNALTVLSILIGIASIFALLSFGQGLTKYTEDIFMEMGTDKIMIQMRTIGGPGSAQEFFTKDDVDFIGKQSTVDEVTMMLYKRMPVTYDKRVKEIAVQFMGTPTDKSQDLFMEFSTYKILEGRNIKQGDRYKVVLGYDYLFENKVFKKALKLGDKIYVQDTEFEIIGFIDKIGNPDDDKSVIVSEEIAREITGKNGYDYIVARMKNTDNLVSDVEKIKKKLRIRLGDEKGDESFFIQTFEELFSQFTSVIAVLNAVLALIAGISIVVASINIINTMYTAVYERTKEIGILKAIGAKNSDVVFIFTLEASVIGFFGGLLGISLGSLIAYIGGRITDAIGYSFLQPVFAPSLFIFCMVLATLVGTFAGVFPARNASRTDPVNCLRYE
ncbi:ABC transporter permease [Candidatus Woesearchaeota archaeon]|nr:ABC transporter permease [Candidatus Woesearchaeota archaeon]